jgi:hypothetical protein
MAFTDNCDLYGAVHEDGINRVLRHLMLQRPSLFNYATADVASNRELWCADVPHTDDVIKYGNPLFTIMPPLPLLGADSPQVVVGYCVQLTRGAIDFHPGNAINLTVELSPPLKPQRFALEFRGCGGIVCPSDKEIERIPFGSAINAAGIADVRRDPITQKRLTHAAQSADGLRRTRILNMDLNHTSLARKFWRDLRNEHA